MQYGSPLHLYCILIIWLDGKALSKAATAFVANLTIIADAHLEKL